MCNTCLEEKHAGVIYGLHTGDFHFRYIGKSVNQRGRFADHKKHAKRGTKLPVYDWIRKHGDAVQMTIIETFTDEDLDQIDEREIFHIAQARALYTEKNLNVSDGGEGRTWTEEQRLELSLRQLGENNHRFGKRWTDEERIAASKRMSGAGNHMYGSTHTEEVRAKLAALAKGNQRWAGKSHTDEAKAKISAAKKGKPSVAMHNRWHVNRNITNPECTFCQETS